MRVYVDELIGRVVKDADGNVVGRIFDVHAEERGGALEIVEFYVGTAAMLQRAGLSLLRVVGINRLVPRKISWDQLDLSDPMHPVLR
jgi:hypothetical protein